MCCQKNEDENVSGFSESYLAQEKQHGQDCIRRMMGLIHL
jgi:hypothetical protein